MLDDFKNEDMNNSNEFLDEFRQRLNSKPLENIDDKYNNIKRSQQIFVSSVLGISLAGLVSWFIFSSNYTQDTNTEIPVVRRPQTSIKAQPADPGGMEILNQDKTVYDIVEKKDTPNNQIETLLPPPEEPVLPSIEMVNIEDNVQETIDQTNIVAQTAQNIIDQQMEKKTVNITTTEKIVEQPKTEAIQEQKVATVEVPNNDTKAIDTETLPKVKNETVKSNIVESKPIAESKTDIADTKIKSGTWQIQLMSSPNRQGVEKAWKTLQLKYADLKGLPYEIETEDLGEKGTFYRLKVGSFIDRSDADKICNYIKNSNGSCLVKKK